MLLYILGPFLAMFPERWRRALPFHDSVPWKSASILSGLAESFLALGALLYWYSYSVTTWVSRGLDGVLNQNSQSTITDHEVGFAALVIFATHPLTWAIGLFGLEGMARLCAALTDTVFGILPLFIVEKIYSGLFRRGVPAPAQFSQSHLSSYMDTLKEKIQTARLSQVPDELCVLSVESEEFLEIRAWCIKPHWAPPRVVRYEDRYYSLEECAKGRAPRPFIYKLRKLSKGVPGRNVLLYSPEEQPIIASF